MAITNAVNNRFSNFIQSIVSETMEYEWIAKGNTGKDQDKNWKRIIDADGNMTIHKRKAGAWVLVDTYTY